MVNAKCDLRSSRRQLVWPTIRPGILADAGSKQIMSLDWSAHREAAMEAGMAQGESVPAELEQLVQPHVDSYNYFLGEGLERVIERLQPMEIEHPITKQMTRFWFENPSVARPLKDDAPTGADTRLFPRDCRESGGTYKAALHLDLCYSTEGMGVQRLHRRFGYVPIMVKSQQCYLRRLKRHQLVARKEESTEMGGYFICNGIERIIRMLLVQRRHYVMALRRGAYRKRGSNFTDMATLIRCVAPDESSATVRCHYLADGNVTFAFTIRRAEYFIPAGILLRTFLEVTDRELYDKLMAGAINVSGGGNNSFVAERAEMIIQAAQQFGLYTRAQTLEYLGSYFRVAMDTPPRRSNFQAGLQLLRQHIFIHLEHPADKLNLMLAMISKLFALTSGECCEDNPDALTHHEILLPGHLLCKFMKERLEESLVAMRDLMRRDLDKAPEGLNMQSEAYIKRTADKLPDLGQKFVYMINTGNLVSRGGLDLSQATGFTVVAEKLNFHRYLSHFRSVHRGAYFAELRTTAVRKLLPESWGFLCPVHTPDGAPCGLLTHLTAGCRVMTYRVEDPEGIETAILRVLFSLGMTAAVPTLTPPPAPAHTAIQLDGKVLGYVPAARAAQVVARLRALKAATLALEQQAPEGAKLVPLTDTERLVPASMEVVHLPYEHAAPAAGIFLFTQPARMMRPVQQVDSGAAELVGTLEQANMSIRVPDAGVGGSEGLRFTHAEFHTSAMLSVIASLTPYSDFNQSPRNMYQCQMAKQTMGTPVQALPHRTDGKLYRIHTPQTPLARTLRYDRYAMDEFPNGTNMVVAVLAYTGYDMEDAMILNKAAVDRGLAHATLYKTETVDLKEERSKQLEFGVDQPTPRDQAPAPRPVGAFGQRFPQNVRAAADSPAARQLRLHAHEGYRDADRVDRDGLPHVGAVVWPGQSYYSTHEAEQEKCKPHNLKGEEVGMIDQVAIVGSGKAKTLQRANIRMRMNRNPVIGDKFASRHGQKGVLSVQWPDADMPYSEATGMRPDLLINPHAFPSRMTIGMLVESLTSKTGALTGQFPDASPFQQCDQPDTHRSPIEEFGAQLERRGFSKLGGETMISGVTGKEFAADIFVGLVYYQRLRHMVSDKFQVRSTGPVNALTRQPIKGRKFGGGIRFGEMERDSLLAHGAAYLLHDRLHLCSDYTVMEACAKCGSLLSAVTELPTVAEGILGQRMLASMMSRPDKRHVVCRVCGTGEHVERVALPYVFRYLATELAAMNIKCSLTLTA